VNEGHGSVRSYQRIFSPERRIHQIEGRPLPVPGGVPLRWLGWAMAALVSVLALGSGSLLIPVVAAAAAGAGGLILRDRTAGLLAAAAATTGTFALGAALGAIDWPIRLVVIPVAVATLATQATPDGRRPERFALSWLALRLASPRRSLGRALPTADSPQVLVGVLWVAPDPHGSRLRRARIAGPAVVHLAEPLAIRRPLLGRGLLARRASRLTPPSRLRMTVEVPNGRTLELRP
jgi:hypothetical protein